MAPVGCDLRSNRLDCRCRCLPREFTGVFHWANDGVDRSSPLHMAVWTEVSLSQVLIAELIGVMYMLHCVR